MRLYDRFLQATIVFGLALFLASMAFGQVNSKPEARACELPGIPTDLRPDPNGPATQIHVGFRLTDLTEIDDIKQTLTGDFAIRLTWTDTRLSQLHGCEIALDKVWTPSVVILNSGRLINSRPREVTILPDGKVSYLQRYYGSIASYHNLREFPFDDQKFAITLFPIDLLENQVQLVNDQSFTGKRDLLNISDWKIKAVNGRVGRQKSDTQDGFRSYYDFEIKARRFTGYYIWKVILPLCLIVSMSWCVFWISSEKIELQVGLSSTSFLTLIAFLFATTALLPKLGYLTRLDWFMLGSTVFVFIALLVSVATGYLVVRKREILSFQIDRVCRIVFPALFALFLPLVFFV